MCDRINPSPISSFFLGFTEYNFASGPLSDLILAKFDLASECSPFESRKNNPLNKIALGHRIQHNTGCGDHHAGRHEQIPLGGLIAAEEIDAQCQRVFIGCVEIDERVKKIVPVA